MQMVIRNGLDEGSRKLSDRVLPRSTQRYVQPIPRRSRLKMTFARIARA
jgi:hypothetical protein